MTRDASQEVLKSYWRSIEKFDRMYSETGNINYLVQMTHLKRMCMEVMGKVKENE